MLNRALRLATVLKIKAITPTATKLAATMNNLLLSPVLGNKAMPVEVTKEPAPRPYIIVSPDIKKRSPRLSNKSDNPLFTFLTLINKDYTSFALFCKVYIIVFMLQYFAGGCRIAVIIPVFQTGDRSSTLRTRTKHKHDCIMNVVSLFS